MSRRDLVWRYWFHVEVLVAILKVLKCKTNVDEYRNVVEKMQECGEGINVDWQNI